VERGEILRVSAQALMGFASAYARWATADEVALPIQRTGCEALLDANSARSKMQLLSSCHALLGSEHCSRAPLSQEIES
jgi:hypothetical protein